MKRTFLEECQEFSDAVHRIVDLVMEALEPPVAWLADKAWRLYLWLEKRKG